MFAVVQLIENQKFKVLVVPVSWIRNGVLLWPKLLSEQKIEELRINGTAYKGATKQIPVIVNERYKKLATAEAAADDLAMKEVSDVDGKKKRLKPEKKKKAAAVKDYNKLFAGKFPCNSFN